jgi:hypothetical protein
MSSLRWSALSERLQAIDHARWDRWLGVVSGAASAAACGVLLGIFDGAATPPAPRTPSASRVAGFEHNRGDAETVVRFLSRADGFLLGLAPAEARLRPSCPLQRCPTIRLRLVGARRAARLVPEGPLPGSAWASVLYDDVYPGIGLRFVGYGGELSYAFLVDRGASAHSIVLELDGVDHIETDAAGGLFAAGPGARLVLPPPTAQQVFAKEPVAVDVRYAVRGRQVRLEVGAYDIRRPLEVSGGRGFLTDPHAAEARRP